MARPFAVLILSVAVSCAATTVAFASHAVPANEITRQFVQAPAQIMGFRAIEVGGIVVLRGRAVDREAALNAGRVAQALGYSRVANLIEVIEPPDDVRIQRTAERQLAAERSLEGCRFTVGSHAGVVHLEGSVYSELQKEVAVSLLQSIHGVRSVTTELR